MRAFGFGAWTLVIWIVSGVVFQSCGGSHHHLTPPMVSCEDPDDHDRDGTTDQDDGPCTSPTPRPSPTPPCFVAVDGRRFPVACPTPNPVPTPQEAR